MFCSDGLRKVGALLHDPGVDDLGHVFQEQLLVVRLHVGALHFPDSGDGVVDAQVLHDGRDHHPGAARPAGAVDQAVPSLKIMTKKHTLNSIKWQN